MLTLEWFKARSFSCRLPIIQGSSITFIACTLAVLDLPQWRCPPDGDLYAMGEANRTEEWMLRMREIQGAIILSSVFEVLIGYLGEYFGSSGCLTAATMTVTTCYHLVSTLFLHARSCRVDSPLHYSTHHHSNHHTCRFVTRATRSRHGFRKLVYFNIVSHFLVVGSTLVPSLSCCLHFHSNFF